MKNGMMRASIGNSIGHLKLSFHRHSISKYVSTVNISNHSINCADADDLP